MRTDRRRATQILLSGEGFSLIELVTFIVVGGIILPASIVAFVGVMSNFSTPDYQVKARFYCQQGMEEITSNAYGDILVTSGDVVDTLPETGFQRKWNICYVTASNPVQCVTGTDTSYKKVTVTVTMPDNSIYDVSTLITKRPKS